MNRCIPTTFKAFAAALLLAVANVPAQRDVIAGYLASMDALTQILAGVKDVPSARALQPKAEGAISLYLELREQVRKLSYEQRKDKNKEMQEAYVRMTDEVKRVRANTAIEKELHNTLVRME